MKVEPQALNRNIVTAGQGDRSTTAFGGDAKQPVKIRAMEPPKWDGRYRTFTRFKLLWDENIATRVADSAQHMMLCESLPKHILDNISTMSNSAEDICRASKMFFMFFKERNLFFCSLENAFLGQMFFIFRKYYILTH